MSRKVIEIVQVLIDRIHQGGYTQRALEDDIYAESQKRIAAEKDRDHWRQARQEAHEAGELMRAELETLRTQLANAERAASDEITERQVLTVEQQQDAAIWQQQLDAARAEIETLKGAMAADDKRLRDAEERVWPGETWGCAAPDLLADEILHLREQLDAATEPTPMAEPAPCPECERLRQQLDAAEAAEARQRTRIERLHKFVGKARLAMWPEDLKSALTELDAATEPLDAEGGA